MTNKSIKYSHFELGIWPDILMVFYYVGFSHNLNVIHTVHFYFKMDKHRWSNKKFNQVNALLYSCTVVGITEIFRDHVINWAHKTKTHSPKRAQVPTEITILISIFSKFIFSDCIFV